MKSPQAIVDDCDDIFGPPRTYPTGYNPPKTRPSMISAKYRQKEERRKVLKISMNKLKKIEDPEVSFCRSVLINNTVKRLQKEARDEKIQKQQLNYPRCYENDNFLNIKSEFIKNELKVFETEPQIHAENKVIEFVETDFDRKLAEEIETVNAKSLKAFEDDSNGFNCNTTTCTTSTVDSESLSNDRFSSRKRSYTSKSGLYDEIDDSDVQDVLSQFYMPPTPRMLTCIDDDEDVNVVDDDVTTGALPKRQKLSSSESDVTDTFNRHCDYSDLHHLDLSKPCAEDFGSTITSSVQSFVNNNNNNLTTNNSDSRLRYPSPTDDLNSLSCGQASMLTDLQSNVYHNLIASLET